MEADRYTALRKVYLSFVGYCPFPLKKPGRFFFTPDMLNVEVQQ
jgi:hypothetical protein